MAGMQPTFNAKIMKEMPQAMPYDQLLIALAEGKEQAYKQLFQQYWPHIYGVVLSLVKSREQAEDISQEIFTKLYHNRQQLKGVQDLQNYLFIIARNTSIDFLRKKVLTTANLETLIGYFQDPQPLPDGLLEYKELDQKLKDAIAQLPAQVREVFIKSRVEGLSHEEIAKELGISVFSSKTYVVRALQRIRKFMESHDELAMLLLLASLVAQQQQFH